MNPTLSRLQPRRRLFTEHRQPAHRWDRLALAIAIVGLIAFAVGTAWARAAGKPCAPPPAGWALDSEPTQRPCVYVPAKPIP